MSNLIEQAIGADSTLQAEGDQIRKLAIFVPENPEDELGNGLINYVMLALSFILYYAFDVIWNWYFSKMEQSIMKRKAKREGKKIFKSPND